MTVTRDNEQLAATAFGLQSKIFDELYSSDPIIAYKRERVRTHVQQYLSSNSAILELNSGTGEDAIWFAQHGHQVHATDIADGMQEVLKTKVTAAGLTELISTENISYNNLQQLQNKKQYDLLFSNFAGLNCTGELDKVLHSFAELVKPGGVVTIVLLPKFCLWEFMLLFKGKFNTAFRRFFSSKGAAAHVEGTHFTCWYYNPAFVIKHLQPQFELLAQEGLCTIVPPSYMEGFAQHRPKLFSFLKKQENKRKARWPWKNIGDYYIISFRKK